MKINKITEALINENPIAENILVDIKHSYYQCSINNGYVVYFEVPIDVFGKLTIPQQMDSKQLIPYIIKNNSDNNPYSKEEMDKVMERLLNKF